MKPFVKNILLAFVLVSVGFLLGKEVTRRSMRSVPNAAPVVPAAEVNGTGNRVIVYYVHATARCVTCNAIENMARRAIESQFKDELAAGRVVWRTDNFQKNEALAQKYGIVSSVVLVVGMRDGKESAFRRLDEVWSLRKDPPAFETYLVDNIRTLLQGSPTGESAP